MAKAKTSPALFEVIARTRPVGVRASSGLLASLTRWLPWKRHATPAGTVIARPAPTPAPDPTPTPPPAPAPAPAVSEPASIAPIEAAPLPPRSAAVTIDPDRYEVKLRLSYVQAIIGVFAIVTLIAAAFIAGRGAIMGSPQPQFANSSSEQLQSQEPKKTIFNIERTPVIVDTPPQGEPATTSQPNASDAQRTSGPVSRVRKAGLNYIIVQSYPEAEMANEAVKVLSENGIDSTVERNLQGWSKDWHIVVGLEGFDRISNSARYDAYVKKIRDISEKYAKKSSFKAFAPTAIKWGGKAK